MPLFCMTPIEKELWHVPSGAIPYIQRYKKALLLGEKIAVQKAPNEAFMAVDGGSMYRALSCT